MLKAPLVVGGRNDNAGVVPPLPGALVSGESGENPSVPSTIDNTTRTATAMDDAPIRARVVVLVIGIDSS